MRLVKELEPIDFEAWGGAIYTLRQIREEGKVEEFNDLAEEYFGESMGDKVFSETEFNDWLWFDRDSIYECLGIEEEEAKDNAS